MRSIFFAVGAIVFIGTGYFLFQLYPPKSLIVAAGPKGGGYYQIARNYQEILARDGITLDIRETAGSGENAMLIEAGQVDAAIVQGGVAINPAGVEAIGAIFFEPMIFLAAKGHTLPPNPANWQGLKINIGAQGSGTTLAFDDFQTVVGLQPDANQLLSMGFDAAIAAVEDGSIDLAVFVAPINAPYLERAFRRGATGLVQLNFTEAISRNLKYAKNITIPAGAASLEPVVPVAPRQVLAMEARLVITDQLHPALTNRLTMAAIELHGARGIMADGGMFPSVDGTGLTVNTAARQIVTNGPLIWQDWLPYWMASQVHRIVLLLLPILFVILPVFRSLPQLYAYMMRRRIWQYYPEVMALEQNLAKAGIHSELDRIDDDLAQLSQRILVLKMPHAYRQVAFNVRMHIGLARQRVRDRRLRIEREASELT